ncbi:hypothetical protein [Micromonospora sp. WMMD712]|uniref:hypothetical protein n=1 Tax=Micromonospora sp. WMMD712 TaxID=3016096 RepID=UPI00249B25CE|nr:hypothetical protein [Micromonospora sp. WMMD712]WFE58616.1 hypothetical protein O7633_17960 [Micromonospora sp. WMMD712]
MAYLRIRRPHRLAPLFRHYYLTEDLPEPVEGTVLVLGMNGVFELAGIERRGVRARADAPVDAFLVSTVNHTVYCTVELNSAEPHRTFTVAARFACFVNDAVALLRNGCTHAAEQLTSYLYGLVNLRAELAKHRVTDLETVHAVLISEAQAEVELSPPSIPGMTVQRPYLSFLPYGASGLVTKSLQSRPSEGTDG